MLLTPGCTKLSMLSTNFWDSPRILLYSFPFRFFTSSRCHTSSGKLLQYFLLSIAKQQTFFRADFVDKIPLAPRL